MESKWYLFSIFIIAIILALYLSYQTKSDRTNERFTTKEDLSSCKNDTIKTLVRQAARWSIAANQDENAMIAVLHANYGAAYLWALRDIATDVEIKNATGIDIIRFRDEITAAQDKATKRMIATCPSYAPTASYLAAIAGEG
jgi:hypothetical protein